MNQNDVRYTIVMRPEHPLHPCENYVHYSLLTDLADALEEAEFSWQLDNPNFKAEVHFIAAGYGWDPRFSGPVASGEMLFRPAREKH